MICSFLGGFGATISDAIRTSRRPEDQVHPALHWFPPLFFLCCGQHERKLSRGFAFVSSPPHRHAYGPKRRKTQPSVDSPKRADLDAVAPPCTTSASTFLNNQSTHDVPNEASEGSAGFNEWWRFYPCIGNAVSPPVIRDIGSAILATLDLADRQTSGTSRPLTSA